MTKPTAIAWLILLMVPAFAEEPPLDTDRPDNCDSPYLVPKGLFQIEGGGAYGERSTEGQRLTATGFPLALLRFGVTDSLELRLGVPGFQFETADTVTGQAEVTALVDSTISMKFRIADQHGAVPQIAFIGTLLIPSGDEGYSTERVDPGFRFAFRSALPGSVSLTYNLGMVWRTDPIDDDTLDTRSFFDWAVTAAGPVGERFAVFGELFGITGVSATGGPLTSTGAGVTYLLTPRIQLDAHVAAGLSSAALDWSVGAGVSYRFPAANPAQFKTNPPGRPQLP